MFLQRTAVAGFSFLRRSKNRNSKIREGAIVPEGRIHTKYSPCVDQTEEVIAAYYRAAKEKDKAVVRQTQGHMLVYKVTEIEDINPSRGRVYVRQFGAFYSKHGKNCFHPKGQTSLVVPTAEVLSWAEQHPHGEFGYSCHRFEGKA